jgi:hypothetical protein
LQDFDHHACGHHVFDEATALCFICVCVCVCMCVCVCVCLE